LAHLDTYTELGNKGHASSMYNCDVLSEVITQGPGLSALTNGTEDGVVDQVIAHILDKPVASDETYGIGSTTSSSFDFKLFKISSTAVIDDATFPKIITGADAGRSVAYLKGKLFYFFRRSGDGAIGSFDLDATFNDTWQVGLERSDLMPVATKEDIMMFGHGSKVGVYFDDDASITLDQLDFGDDHDVVDIVFHRNQWLIAVNSGISGGRVSSQIYSYGGGATESVLSDEIAVGLQKIGFIMPLNGIIYVCYQDLTGSNRIGYISGNRIEPLVSFEGGTLPDHRQKTLYKNMILFGSSGNLYTAGAISPELPYAISQHSSSGYSEIGAVAAPFGTPIISTYLSLDTPAYSISKFSDYVTSSNWRSIIIPTSAQKSLGYVDYIEVFTRTLGTGARCDLKLEINQATETTGAYSIVAGKTRHIFPVNKKDIEDLRLFLDWSNGSTSNPCEIRKIILHGHYAER
jgi:hypothetical protein